VTQPSIFLFSYLHQYRQLYLKITTIVSTSDKRKLAYTHEKSWTIFLLTYQLRECVPWVRQPEMTVHLYQSQLDAITRIMISVAKTKGFVRWNSTTACVRPGLNYQTFFFLTQHCRSFWYEWKEGLLIVRALSTESVSRMCSECEFI
jgi:hypothetical protein